jgi:hypothetical protein
MKRVVVLLLAVLALTACKPQKPWSPYDAKSDPAAGDGQNAPKSPLDQVDANIGDVEQAIYVDGVIAQESAGPNVAVTEVRDRNKRLLKSEVILKEPYPQSLWADYEIKSTRNFMSAPVVLRAKIMVNDKVAGTFSEVLGTQAVKTKVTAKIDLLKPFEGNVPETFLAKIDGDLYLMPNGTDENKVNPETATADIHSKAMYASLIRATLQKPGSVPEEPVPAPAPAPSDPSTGDPLPSETDAAAQESDGHDHEHGQAQDAVPAAPTQPTPPTSE